MTVQVEALTYEALKAQCDALADRVERLSGMLTESRVATKSAEERADALAVENAEMRSVIDAAIGVANNSSGIAGWHLNGEIADWDEILPELNIETPATSAALAAIQAQGVEKAQAVVSACRENICPGGLSENRQYEESIVQPHLDGIADELENLIIELREAK
ncbi:hypothetical protein [Serratia marcescens]|uniref:hypothetical protein n=1 Tax=Serratia marcescens TaxID=615 RepID=UPI001495937A|nr:hypothetical protein [Serratia marcescens]MDP8648025.1 hypothetical protein [Serratia marcescens]